MLNPSAVAVGAPKFGFMEELGTACAIFGTCRVEKTKAKISTAKPRALILRYFDIVILYFGCVL